jgi:hypothetical protein
MAMELIKIKGVSKENQEIVATFNKDKGMNLMSLKFGDIEVIDQTTSILYNQRAAGLGALIGPHFHHRKDKDIPPMDDPFLFPHLELLREKAIKEPFSHGIARYVPWDVVSLSPYSVHAKLSSKSSIKNVTYGFLEGMEFEMHLRVDVGLNGLLIDYSIISNKPSCLGLHYYYALDKSGQNVIESFVDEKYVDNGQTKKLTEAMGFDIKTNHLKFDLVNASDYNFIPFKNKLSGLITLKNPSYSLNVRYSSGSSEHSWQLYHPKGSSYVCIEPLSAKLPRSPVRTVNGITTLISLSNPDR